MKGKPNKEFMLEIRRMKCISDFNHNAISLDELYSTVIKLIKNKNLIQPISIDIDTSRKKSYLFLELNSEEECWDYYNVLNYEIQFSCSLLKYYTLNNYYSVTDNFRRLPYCQKCFQGKATHCNKKYCKECAKSEPSFIELFYEIPQDVISNVMMKYLNINDLLKLQITCNNMNDYLNDYRIWKRFMEEREEVFRLKILQMHNDEFNNQDKSDYPKKLFLHIGEIIHQRLRTKSCIIIQKNYRRYKYPKKAMRKILSSLTYYLDYNDYTRDIEDSLRIGTDFKTKLVYDKYDIKFKMRKNYQDALNGIEEPIFD